MQISISHAFHNKDAQKGTHNPHQSFEVCEMSVEELAKHIESGHAIAIGVYNDNDRKQKNFITSWLLALDLDENISVADCLQEIDINQCAAIVHPTPSHTETHAKTRVLFVLDKPIPDESKWLKAQEAVYHHFRHLKPDKKCIDSARFYYGSTKHGMHRNLEARLPVNTTLKRWVDEYQSHKVQEEKRLEEELERIRNDAPNTPESGNKRTEAYANATYKNILDEITCAKEGDRNDTLNKGAYALFGMALGRWPGFNESRIASDLQIAGEATGLDKAEVRATIRSARNSAVAKPLTLPQNTNEIFSLAKYNPDDDKPIAEQYQQVTINQLMMDMNKLYTATKQANLDADEIIKLSERVNSATDSLLSQSGHIAVIRGVDATREAFAQIKERREQGASWVIGLRSGLKQLDYGTGGYQEGAVHSFLGATGTGKSQLCATNALELATQGRGLILSCEVPPPIFAMRMAACVCGIAYGSIKRNGHLRRDENHNVIDFDPFTREEELLVDDAMNKVMNILGKSDTVLYPGSAPTPAMIRSIVRQYSPLAWVIIDSINNVQLPFLASEYERVSEAAINSERVAMDYKTAVIQTAQVGRNTKDRKDKRPGIHDARGSGVVEEKSSFIGTMYNHWYHVAQGDIDEGFNDERDYHPKGTVQISVAKLRDGESGTKIVLGYKGGCGFYNFQKSPDKPKNSYANNGSRPGTSEAKEEFFNFDQQQEIPF